jgi:hypothetical protein
LLREYTLFGERGFLYFDKQFPYQISYTLDGNDDVAIGLLMRAFTS